MWLNNTIKVLSPPVIVPIIAYAVIYSDRLWGNPVREDMNTRPNK